MLKISKKILVILLLSIIFISNASNIIRANYQIQSAYIEQIGEAKYHLKYYNSEKGMYTYSTCSIVGHYIEGKFYPAYCLDRNLKGVGKVPAYTVEVEKLIDNNKIWRAVKNGYPYKTAKEMGLSSEYDAYAVTKFAIYCLTGQADVNVYQADENDLEGQNMLKALRNLVDIGDNGTENFNNELKITPIGELVDEGSYYTMTYQVSSNGTFPRYLISSIEGVVGGDIITDEKGKIKTDFSAGEKFKIKISKSNLNTNKNIKLKIKTNSKNYPMYYGKTNIEGTQNYLLTSKEYGDLSNTLTFNLKLDTGKIIVNKIDDENKKGIKDVEFELYNSNGLVIERGTTNENGYLEFKNLFPGDYILKEIKTNENYILEKNVDFNVNVTYNQTTSIVVENEHKKGNLTIYKVDKDNNNIALGNVEFELYSKETGEKIGTYFTDANGKIEIKNLRTGSYMLKEISTNQWYNLAEDSQIEIKWNETTKTIVQDELKKSQVQVKKVDKDNNEIKIPNVTFEVLDENDNLLETITTNEEGLAYTSEYALRDFQKIKLHETKTDKWYKLNDEKTEITLEANQIKSVVIENEKKKGQIQVIKVDKDNNEIKIPGVKFNVLDEEKNIVDALVTNEEGIAISKKLPIDKNYTIQEIETKENYVLIEELKTLTLKEDEITNIIFQNEKKKGQIKVIKVDSENNEIKLENVEFNVLDEAGNIVDKLKTDKEGIAISKRLPIDQKYLLQEIKTNEKYILSDEIKTITLKEDEIKDVIIENEKIKGKIKIIKTTSDKSEFTGIEKGKPLEGVVFEIYDENKNLVDTVTTNKEGIALTKDLEKGKYKLKETLTNEWYILDENYYNLEIKTNKEILTLNIENTPGTPDEEIEKTGPNEAKANEEIEYKINVKNTGNVPLDNFIWEDAIPTDYIRVNKINLGTYNQQNTYNLYYKTNFTEDYVLFLEDINTLNSEEIDFSKELSINEYITNIKLEFKKVDQNFSSEIPTSIFAKVNPNVKRDDIFENKVTLNGTYNGYNLTKDSSWKTKVYEILPLTGM